MPHDLLYMHTCVIMKIIYSVCMLLGILQHHLQMQMTSQTSVLQFQLWSGQKFFTTVCRQPYLYAQLGRLMQLCTYEYTKVNLTYVNPSSVTCPLFHYGITCNINFCTCKARSHAAGNSQVVGKQLAQLAAKFHIWRMFTNMYTS